MVCLAMKTVEVPLKTTMKHSNDNQHIHPFWSFLIFVSNCLFPKFEAAVCKIFTMQKKTD